MHFSIFLSLWSLFFLSLYKFASYVSTEIRHRNNAKRMGCKPSQSMAGRDPIGIDNIMRLTKADRECRLPEYIRERTESISSKQGRRIYTFHQNVLGSPAIFTLEPENVKTILATKFKDFELGDTRNNNFFPLLGFGIVSCLNRSKFMPKVDPSTVFERWKSVGALQRSSQASIRT
jgi:hypothetical protein